MKKNIFMYGSMIAVWLALVVSCGGGANDKVEFVIANGTEPESIDPHKISGVPEHKINIALFEGLVRANPQTSKAEPAVAESWSVEGNVYTMHLRKDLKWSDGVPITAETVRDSWYRILDPATASPYSWFPALFIAGAKEYNDGKADRDSVAIKAVDAHTFQFETVGPLPYTLDALSHYSFGIVPLHAIEKHGNDWTLPENFVGNGPFVLSNWNPQEILTAEKNTMYWDSANVFIDSISFIPTDDENTMFNMYENKEVDWSVAIPESQYSELKGREDFHVSEQLAVYYYSLNLNLPIFKDIRVRKAFTLSIGREDIAYKLLNQGQTPAYGMVPPMDDYTPIDKVLENEELAKSLLAEAGYPDGKGFPEVTILYNTSEGHKKIAEFIQQRWKEVLGVNIKLENKEWKTFLKTRQNHEFDIARGGWVGDYLDPNTFLDMFITGSDLNDPAYASSAYDALIKKAATLSGEERMDLLRKAETLFVNEDVGIIPIYFYVKMNLIDTQKWDGWYINTQDVHPYVGIKLK